MFILSQPSFSCPYFLDFYPPPFHPARAYLSLQILFLPVPGTTPLPGLFYLFSLITQIPNFIDSRAYLGPLNYHTIFSATPRFGRVFPPSSLTLSDLSSLTPSLTLSPSHLFHTLSTSFCYQSLTFHSPFQHSYGCCPAISLSH